MITIRITYPNSHTVERRLAASQAQMIIDAMRADGAAVEIIENPTSYIIR